MSDILGKVIYAFNRFKEPSSYAALSGLCAAIGINFPGSQIQAITNGLAVLFGIVGVFVKEYHPSDSE